MRQLFIIIFVLFCFQGFSQRDSIIAKQKFNGYTFSDMNITPNWSTGFFYNLDIGFGLNYKELKFEISFPAITMFDSLNYFKRAYKVGIGLNFIARKNYMLSFMFNYLNYHNIGHKELYDYAGPSILVPINFTEHFQLHNLNFLLRWTKTVNDRFKWYINSGLAIYEFRTTAIMDSDGSTRIIDAGYPDEADMKCFTIGLGISFKIYEK